MALFVLEHSHLVLCFEKFPNLGELKMLKCIFLLSNQLPIFAERFEEDEQCSPLVGSKARVILDILSPQKNKKKSLKNFKIEE